MSTALPLAGKTALITGGSRSLGLEMARTLLKAGAYVAITARTAEALDTAAAELGPGALPIVMDVQDGSSVRRAFAEVDEAFGGRLDILVNNAAIGLLHPLETAPEAALRRQLDTNVLGPLLCMQAAIPLLRAAGGGDMVTVSSESVRHPFPLLGVYAATKAAVECLAQGLRDELAPDGIRVSILRCGSIADSGFGSEWTQAERTQAFALWQRSGHLAFAGTAVSAHSIASALLHMVTLPVDGGIDLLEVRGRAARVGAA